jgi:ATP-dependent RNA helicase DDX41
MVAAAEEAKDSESSEAQARLEAWKKKREERKRRQQQQMEQDDFLAVEQAQEEEDEGNGDGDGGADNENDDDDKAEFVPFAKRRREEQLALLEQDRYAHRRRILQTGGDSDGGEEEHPTKKSKGGEEGGEANVEEEASQEKVESLLESAAALHQSLTEEEKLAQHRKEEETRILKEANKVQNNALQAASEVASGVLYAKPLPSTWTCPKHILDQGVDAWTKIRKEWHMDVEGNDIPPPCKRFQDMKFPQPILDILVKKGIKRPTPIQMQGLTVALAARDMIGIAFTGSGKTLTFSLPLVMAALEEELRLPLVAGEGPIGIILAPSRELARQTFDVVDEFCKAISDTPEYPELRCQLLIGGESVRDQTAALLSRGIHCVVATPGRLRDVLKRRTMKLDNCRYICLDEADRMLDLGFDEEVGEIMNHFPHQRQTLLFSATFPKKFQDFARDTLVQPIVVNVGRAGAANLDVIQEVEVRCLLHPSNLNFPSVAIYGFSFVLQSVYSMSSKKQRLCISYTVCKRRRLLSLFSANAKEMLMIFTSICC